MVAQTPCCAPTPRPPITFEFVERPVIAVHKRLLVVLDDVQLTFGVQIVRVAALHGLAASVRRHAGDAMRAQAVQEWFDGSAVCYVRIGSAQAVRAQIEELPVWLAAGRTAAASRESNPA